MDLLKASAEALGRPEAVLADIGCQSENSIDLREVLGMTPYVTGQREKHNQPPASSPSGLAACPEDAAVVERARRRRLNIPEGKAVHAKRRSMVETVFGVVKEAMGFRRFHLRGKSAVYGEWTLASIAWNPKRMPALSEGTS